MLPSCRTLGTAGACSLVLTVSLSATACTHTVAASTSQSRADRADTAFERARPGVEVSGTRVRVPSVVRAGDLLIGRAPPGSVIVADDRRHPVGEDGHFQVQAPRDAGWWRIRIERPAPSTALSLRIRVDDAGMR